jgi:hypothetical protein
MNFQTRFLLYFEYLVNRDTMTKVYFNHIGMDLCLESFRFNDRLYLKCSLAIKAEKV